MKRLIETIRNIFKIEELRKRILFTILIILVYRFGSFVVIPGVDPNQLSIIQTSSLVLTLTNCRSFRRAAKAASSDC